MKINKTILISITLSGFFLFGQTPEERNKIIAKNDFNSLKELRKNFIQDYGLRQIKIEEYLKISPSQKKFFKINGNSFMIYDIVNGKPVYMSSYNSNSAIATRTNKLHNGGTSGFNLDGENMIIGMWDINHPLPSHVEFLDDDITPTSRIEYPDLLIPALINIDDHATHVGGTLISKGTNSASKGMAPKANLRAFTANKDVEEAINEASNGLLISNHSYGIPIFYNGNQQVPSENIGSYSSSAATWDGIAYNAPYYLAVMSAGNEGGTSNSYPDAMAPGYDKLTYNKTAKNILVVASGIPIVSAGNLTNFLSSDFSSEGPTDDFRIKPDITGDGNAVFSCFSGSDNEYGTLYGTSMSSPNIAGSLLLLQEFYNRLNSSFMKSATLKALVCHTAQDDLSKIGPDPTFGWGFLNAEKAANTIYENENGTGLIRELTLNNGESYTYQFTASAAGKITATICWTDPAGTAVSGQLNNTTPKLVNDLDLRIENSAATIFTPWMLNSNDVTANAIKGDNIRDNIERIDIPNPIGGTYTLTVNHKNSLTNGSQDFALIITGADITLSSKQAIKNEILIWPNPVSKHLNINLNSFENNFQIYLYDVHGRTVYKDLNPSSNYNNTYSINIKKFVPGLYLLSIKNGNKQLDKKIIIQ